MGWSSDPGWSNGAVLTAANLNTYLRDNLFSLRDGNDVWVKLYLSGNPSIPNNVTTNISWDSVAFSAGGIWSAGNPTRLTAPTTGKYLVFVNIEWRSNSTNLRNISITRTGGGVSQYPLQSQGATGGKSNVCGKLLINLSATNYLEIGAFQSSGGALTLHGGTRDRTRVAMMFLGT